MPLNKKQQDALKEIAIKRKQIADSPYKLFYIGDFDYIDLWEYVDDYNNRISKLVKDNRLPAIQLQTFSAIDCPDIGSCMRATDGEELKALVDRSLADIYDKVELWSNSVISYLDNIDKIYNTYYSVLTRSPNADTSADELNSGLYVIFSSDRLCEVIEQHDSSFIIRSIDNDKYLACVSPEITGGYIKLSSMTYESNSIDEARQSLEAHIKDIALPQKQAGDVVDLTMQKNSGRK